MAAKLLVTKDTGELLFDTTKIAYGFVKSGYMVYIERWSRYIKPFTNTDPDAGSSWQLAANLWDDIYGFSVANARCPIAFIVGPGNLSGTSVSGTTMTFLYTNATTATKFYCFDLMADNIAGGPYLKTYNDQGVITFNSLQIPLNVVASIQAPPPGDIVWNGYRNNPYKGGRARQTSSGNIANFLYDIDVALPAGKEYAAHLPWTRGCRVFALFFDSSLLYFGLSEGVYGRSDGITFMFSSAGATNQSNYTQTPGRPSPLIDLLPVDRFPVALVIETAAYPFPYG